MANCIDCGIILARYNAKRCRKCCNVFMSSRTMGGLNPFFGKQHTNDYVEHMKELNSGSNNPMYGISRWGNLSPNWRGGITDLKKAVRLIPEYIEWRLSIYIRDNFTCRVCGVSDVYLECHHIKPIVDIFREYNIQSIGDALGCEYLWKSDNAITVCEPCHCKVDKSRRRFGIVKTKLLEVVTCPMG